ncbi:3-oxoacyl-ACP synthase III [Trichlorobacter ammonificans]|uniref:3-Oxoacyl-(Acyl-carrier-protein (ACP)) synthase III domain protein n=1 Tax=Trichlorobacter ammonificans TaxID=2916410 RepID=A0ABN8HJN8_9BACT|nr:3-oxoacyl-ACP synthase III [Trichlorobacter ammonificans]CAH2031279.1 3-Oxoacyl-(Acyl-carrier-protein (ACP)) synthase III domain protein [Trichlorobacter ammonificans]
MRYRNVCIEALDYELAPVVVATADLEARLEPLYRELRIAPGQVQAMTGIRERRWWEPGYPLSQGAIAAGRKVLESTGIRPADIGALLYTGVCREQFEPATACRVADGLGISGAVVVQDLSNACLGVLSGMLDIANRIELGQIRAGLVVSSESAREINEEMIARMLAERNMQQFAGALATLTGGSGAVAVLLSDGSFGNRGHRLLGGITMAEPRHHGLCLWGVQPDGTGGYRQTMTTDGVNVMNHGVELGRRTWQAFLPEVGWQAEQVDRVICHQVGSAHQKMILETLGIAEEKDFTTFEYLGNMGTVSLPLTAALAVERDILLAGDKVAFLGIGSGLNCMMLAVEW